MRTKMRTVAKTHSFLAAIVAMCCCHFQVQCCSVGTCFWTVRMAALLLGLTQKLRIVVVNRLTGSRSSSTVCVKRTFFHRQMVFHDHREKPQFYKVSVPPKLELPSNTKLHFRTYVEHFKYLHFLPECDSK